MTEQIWLDDLELGQELFAPQLDDIYHLVFGDGVTVQRVKGTYADKELSIDAFIYFPNGMRRTSQEKVRRYNQLGHDDFTLEYYSNATEKSLGEWFKLNVDYYLYAWVNERQTGFARVRFFKVREFKELSLKGILKGEYEANKAHSNATFCAFPFKDFPLELFLYRFPEKEFREYCLW